MSYTPEFEKKGFINSSTPAINAENLNDMEDTIKKLDDYMPNVDGKSSVSVFRHLSAGTPTATIVVDGVAYTLYCKNAGGGGGGSTVGYNPALLSGTLIGTLTIDGVDFELYAPTGGGGGTWGSITGDIDDQTDLKNALDAKANAPTILTQTLTAGQTTLTFTNGAITSTSLVSIYVDHAEAKPVDLDDSTVGTIVLVFNEQATDLVVKLVIE